MRVNTLPAKGSFGTGAPLRVQDSGLSPRDRVANRVSPRMCSAANWSREMLLRKPARCSGCGAAVRKLKWESWLGPTFGCANPETTVKSFRKSLMISR